jgi:hypothetical protein
LIEHFSYGNGNAFYFSDSIKFEKKWKINLPACLDPLSRQQIVHLEGYALASKLAAMKRHQFTVSIRWGLLKNYFRHYKNWYHLIRCLYFGFIK